jgi:DNA-binding LytR/AlgR family response regulator
MRPQTNLRKKEARNMKITLEPAQLSEVEVIIRGDTSDPEVAQLLQLLGSRTSGRLMVHREEEQFVLDTTQIVYLETADNRVMVHTATETYESRQKLYELMEQLGRRSFVQVSKSTIVNLAFVKSIQAEFSGNYLIKLKNRNEKLTLSRKFFREFKERI